MRVERLGEGAPEVAVVAAIHGDEPCGVRAVERLLEDRPSVRRPVKVVVANERALDREVRYVDEDLNRAFPGDPDAETHEGRLAARLADELEGCLTLSLHSTQSHAEPFALVNGIDDLARDVCPRLPVGTLVDTGPFDQGRLFVSVDRVVEVECGRQGSDQAAENADRIVRDFLTATGALAGDTVSNHLPVFRLTHQVDKEPGDEYEVFVENFERVTAGEPYAAIDGVKRVAERDFYPVLMSPYGYGDVFGYAAERVGSVEGSVDAVAGE